MNLQCCPVLRSSAETAGPVGLSCHNSVICQPREMGGLDFSGRRAEREPCRPSTRDYFFHRFSRTTALRAVRGVGSLPLYAGPEVTHRGVAVHDRDCARSGGEGFRAHDREGIVEGHHLAATYAPGGMHVIVAVRTPTFDEAVFPQLK